MADWVGEYRAAITLALCLPEQFYAQVYLNDKPDLHYVDEDIGVEVTQALPKDIGEIMQRARRVYKEGLSKSHRDIDRLEKLGYKVHEKNGKATAFSSTNGFIFIGDEESLECLRRKIAKSTEYEKHARLDLYIHTVFDWYEEPEEVRRFIQGAKSIAAAGMPFSCIYLDSLTHFWAIQTEGWNIKGFCIPEKIQHMIQEKALENYDNRSECSIKLLNLEYAEAITVI